MRSLPVLLLTMLSFAAPQAAGESVAATPASSLAPGAADRNAAARAEPDRNAAQRETNAGPDVEPVIQSSHTEKITALTASPDGALVASASADGTVKLWSSKTGLLLRTLSTGSYWVYSIAFSPDGATLAAGSGDHNLYFWNVAEGRRTAVVDTSPVAAKALAFSADGSLLAFAGRARNLAAQQVGIWDVAAGKPRTPIPTALPVTDIAFVPQSSSIALATGKRIVIWDMAAGRVLQDFEAHGYDQWAQHVVLSADGNWLASSGYETTIVPQGSTTSYSNLSASVSIWRVSRGTEAVPAGRIAHLWGLAFNRSASAVIGLPTSHSGGFGSDGPVFRVVDGSGAASLVSCDVQTALCQPLAAVPFAGPIPSVLSPDGTWVASAQGPLVATVPLDGSTTIRGVALPPAPAVTALAVSADGSLAVGMRSGQVGVWDRRWQLQSRGVRHVVDGVTAEVRYLEFASPGSGKLYSFGEDGHLLELDAIEQSSPAILYRADASRRTSTRLGGREEVGVSRPGAPKAFRIIGVQEPKRQEIYAAAVSQSAGLIAIGGFEFDDASSNGFFSIRRLADREQLEYVVDPARGTEDVKLLSFSPDGKLLAIGFEGGAIDLWSVSKRQIVRTLPGDVSRTSVLAFSPDSRWLASGGQDGRVLLLDVVSGASGAPLAGHGAAVLAATFSTDGALLATGGNDNKVMVWDVATRASRATLTGHTSAVNALAFLPGRSTLASGGEDGSVRIWDFSSSKTAAILLPGTNDSDWLATAPAGFFDGAPAAWPRVVWRFNSGLYDVAPVEIGFRDYFTANLLSKAVGNEALRPCRAVSTLNRTQPTVTVVSVVPSAPTAEASALGTAATVAAWPTVDVTVRVDSAASRDQRDRAGRALKSGAYDLRLFRDGQLIARSQPDPFEESQDAKPDACGPSLDSWRSHYRLRLDASDSGTVTFRRIPLPQRRLATSVSFSAYAFNADRVKSVTSRPVQYQVPAATGAQPPRAYIITMGVNANESHWDLDLAVPSADKARSLFRERLASRYATVVEVALSSDRESDGRKLRSASATKRNLQTALDILAGRNVDPVAQRTIDPDRRLQPAAPDDLVLVYIASHGYADPQGHFYLIPYDTGPFVGMAEDVLTRCSAHPTQSAACADARTFAQRSISSADLGAWWDGIDARDLLLIVDSCFAGAAVGRTFRPGPLGDPGLGQLIFDKGMRVLLAAQPTQTDHGDWIESGQGETLLAGALGATAPATAEWGWSTWLRAVQRTLPATMHRRYPDVPDSNLQVPEFLDFAPGVPLVAAGSR